MSDNKSGSDFSAKRFFHSNAFKCIAALLSIMLVCGILLTICNSLFYVSAEEELERAINKIYGESVTATAIDITSSDIETTFTNGTIESVYYIEEDGNYLVEATGTGGFSGGSVTCWIVVRMTDGAVSGVNKVVISSNSGQSYINKVNKDSVLEQLEGSFSSVDDELSAWQGTGATYSLNAIVNSINTALEFVRSQLAENSLTSGTSADCTTGGAL